MALKLDRMVLQGFKSIRSMDLAFGELNLLIGPNGAGKSNLIGFFRFMHNVLNKDMQFHVSRQGGAERLLHFGSKITDSIFTEFDFGPFSYSFSLVPSLNGDLVFEWETCSERSPDPQSAEPLWIHTLVRGGAKESGLPRPGNLGDDAPDHVLLTMSGWIVYHFHDTGDTAAVKKPCNIHDNAWLHPDAGNLAAFLHLIRQEDVAAYADIVETVRRIAPFFHDFVLEPDRLAPDQIRLRWKHRGTDAYFDANDLSDGTLRFIALATLLLQPDPAPSILIDEPELGLHPHAIELLGGMMRSASTRTQIIASTQSVTLANQIPWRDLIIVDRVDEASVFRRLTEAEVEPWLDAYGPGDLWRKNLIGGTP
ncbi:AAA family ATPase [Azospirillum sp. RWY-5-1]|uniref:AAA family ATPase n=1 Tax=Azospirillum oleiclasticum TaxID=2735135 RepID=A0ABX2TFE9_9PROT|nr:AAA family ATPase [Azospirillum oleiclasticum]NYZ15652.1 AAA family ATPase [Azospirillum oleiclasticum]NYZ21922.1 AAA family ATPase [Azospirillum oleiclasticum]